MYRTLRIFLATALELEGERRAFTEAVGSFNQTTAMHSGVLYVPVTLLNIRDKRPYQYAVEENIRDARHMILALTDDWGPAERNFERDYRYGLSCAADPNLPMKNVALLARDPAPFDLQFSERNIATTGFAGVDDFRQHITGLLSAWLREDAAAQTQTA